MPKKSKKSKDKSSADAAPEEEEDFPVSWKGEDENMFVSVLRESFNLWSF